MYKCMNTVMHNIIFRLYKITYIVAFLLFCSSAVYAQSNGSVFRTVVLDPGHGGRDPGAIGARTQEKNIVLDIALRLGKMINEKYPDVEVLYTRKTDEFVEFHRRAAVANDANANLFISIHANAVEGRCNTVSGTESFVMGYSNLAANLAVAKRENAAMLFEDDHSIRYAAFDPNSPESIMMSEAHQQVYLEQSISFAREVQNQFKSTARRVDRGVKQARLIVLWQTAMPSILVEVGFICNPEEERYMSSEAGKNQLANALFQAFSTYKEQIEDRSPFYQPANVATQTPTTPTTTPTQTPPPTPPPTSTPATAPASTPATAPASTPTTAPTTTTPAPTPTTPAATTTPKVEFCIQIYSSANFIETTPNNFQNYTDVERFQISQNLYRYIVGRTTDYAAAREYLAKVRADFDGAFMVSIIDGRVAPLAEGLGLIE